MAWLMTACALLDSCTYIIYNWEFWRGRSKPNRILWGVWTYLALLNATSYHTLLTQGFIKTFLAYENLVMCMLTFICVCIRGTTEPVSRSTLVSGVLGTIAGIAWAVFRKAEYANVILQAGTTITMLSLCGDLWKNPRLERSVPWLLWSVIYATFLIVAMKEWSGAVSELIYPLNYFILHLVVFLLTLRGSATR